MRSPQPNPSAGERGSASIVAAAMIAALVVITAGSAHIGAAVIARHRAQAAADLTALAAAAYLPTGMQRACAQASALAAMMGTTAVECSVHDLDVVVVVEAPVRIPASGPARAIARAGPAG
ncbi:Rv3654c family TadE-like protein [Mycolicibacterium hippocampi]|uniref:Rv3654c family TadE-like protein n=1 Tax=Mycolicibacterium hippocampi TaxID=659824 RepID=UPI003515C35E